MRVNKKRIHSCGCETSKYKDGIKIKRCQNHKDKGWVWVALRDFGEELTT